MRGRAWLSAWTSRGSCGPSAGPRLVAAGAGGLEQPVELRKAVRAYLHLSLSARLGKVLGAPQSLYPYAGSAHWRGVCAWARQRGHWSLLTGRSPLGCGCLGSCSARGHHSCSPGGSSGPYGVIIRSGTSTSRTASRSTAWCRCRCPGHITRCSCRCRSLSLRWRPSTPVLCTSRTAAARGGAARRCVSTRAAAPRGRPVAGGGAPAPALSGPGLSRPASRHGFPVLAARRTWIHGPGGVDPGAPRLPAVARVVSLGMVIARRCPVGLRVRGPVQRSPPGFGSYGPR